MGLFKLFGGKSAADHEHQGDSLAQKQMWGDAKLAYEAALDKLDRQPDQDPQACHRLQDKVRHSKEALARAQHQEATELIEAGCMEDARELLSVALELTADQQLKALLIRQMQHTEPQIHAMLQPMPAAEHPEPEQAEPDPIEADSDDYFDVLLNSLPENVQQAYRRYGYHFKQGYLALNRGDFDLAVEHLAEAAQDNPSPLSLVPLELATAHLNLGRTETARTLLEELLQHRPDLLPAFELLCEIYWEEKRYTHAEKLLDSLPPELAQSKKAFILRGETLLLAARNQEAQTFFQDLLNSYGWDQTIALGLARAHEAQGQTAPARDLYSEIINHCTGCGTRIDPAIKRKYADLSLAEGDYSIKLLEHYLALAQEDPANAADYYHNTSRIYAALGNDAESRRFKAIADQVNTKR